MTISRRLPHHHATRRSPIQSATGRRRLMIMITGCAVALSGVIAPAQAEPRTGFTADPTTKTSREAASIATDVQRLPGGDRVALRTAGGGRTELAPLPRPDGSRPGLLLGHSDEHTTVQALTDDAAPTTVAGRPPAPVRRNAADQVELRLKAIGRDGRPAQAHVTVYDVENGAITVARQLPGDPDAPCSADVWSDGNCILLPAGSYSVMGFVTTNPADEDSTSDQITVQSVALVGDPQTKITGDRTITLDARRAEPVQVSTPGRRTKINPGGALEISYTRTAANGRSVTRELVPPHLLDNNIYLQPTARVDSGDLQTRTRLRLEAPDIELYAPGVGTLHPEYYDAVWFSDVASEWPMFDGSRLLRVVDIGTGTRADLRTGGRSLKGAIALAERSDRISVAEQSRRAAEAGAAMIIVYSDSPGDSAKTGGSGVKVSIPTLRMDRAEGLKLARLAGRAPGGSALALAGGESASPYLYDLLITEDDRIPRDLSYRFPLGRLSTQMRSFHAQSSDPAGYSEAAYPWHPGEEFSLSTMFPLRDGPRTRTEYRLPDPDTAWTYMMATPELPYNALFPHDPVLPMALSDWPPTSYEARDRVQEPMGAAPISAAPNTPVQRAGDQMRISIDGFADADGNQGTAYSDDSGMSTLLQISADGELIGGTPNLPSGTALLPAGDSRVEIAFTADNPQSWTDLSTHTETRWVFDSDSTDGSTRTEPLLLPDYDVPVDLHNRVRSTGKAITIGLDLDHQDGAKGSTVDTVRLDVSYDDGATWKPAKVRNAKNGYRVELPRGRGFASLRLHAADRDDSTIDQTIIRAFAVR